MIADSCFHHGWRHAQGGMHAAEIVVQKKWRDHVPMVLYPTKPKRRVPVTALTARPNFHSWMEREVDSGLWVSRLLSELGHEVIVAHARNVRLIGESRRKD